MSNAVSIKHGAFGRVALLQLDHALVAHAHPQSHVLIKTAGADTRFAIGDRILPLSSHRGVFVGPWEPHDYPHASAAGTVTVLALYLEPHWLAARLPSGGAQVAGCSLAITPAVARCAATLCEKLGDPQQAGIDDQSILALLAVLTPAEDLAVGRCSGLMLESEIDRRLRKTLAAMREQLAERPDFEQLARHAGLSRPHFFELFRRELKLTPHLYWNVLRMETALQQVGDENLPLSAVAANLGFTAQSNFSRFFRDIQGVAPQEYRRIVTSTARPARQAPAVAALRFF